MRIVVKFFHDEKASGELAVTAQVIHEQEAGGEQADEPVELVADTQVTFEVGCSENEYPGGGIESCTPAVTGTQIQAVLDEPGASGLRVNPTYAKALGTERDDAAEGAQGVQRYQAIDAAEMSDAQAMLLCELGGEEPPSGAVVIDAHADPQGETDLVAFIPREVGGIVPGDMAQRVAVLMALGEPTATAEPPTPVASSSDLADPQKTVEPRLARPEARAAQLLQIRTALKMAVGELRALGSDGQRVAEGLQGLLDGNAALRDAPSLTEAITPEEAKTMYAVWAGDAFDAQFLESVQPKLEAIAGESWR